MCSAPRRRWPCWRGGPGWPMRQAGLGSRTLELVAVLSAAGVGRALLGVAGEAGVLAADGRRVTAAELDQALDQLARRALVTFTVDGQTVIMHRLVAWVIRDELARRERLTAVCRSAASMLEARLETVAGSPDRQAVRDFPEQVAAVAANAG